MNLTDLRTLVGRKLGALGLTPEQEAEQREKELDKWHMVPNRSSLREAGLKSRPVRPYHPPRARTGQPAHFLEWKREAEIQRLFSAMPTATFLDQAKLKLTAKAREEIARSYTSVWQLIGAKRLTLLALEGVGPAALKAVQKALIGRGLRPKWSEEDK